jgi:GDP-D-glucose phosphorylase
MESIVSNNSVMTLIFSENDFIQNQTNIDSNFDQLLKSKWTQALDKGVFRYKVTQNSLLSKVITPGKYNFIAQLNEGRGALRRKPDDMTSLQMPFNTNKFNFTKIKSEEILFKIKSSNNESEATIIINSSPIEFCNALLVPHLDECKPQIFTAESLRLAICVLALSGHQTLRLGFNSLGAMASVNHLHWHLYYYDYDLLIEKLAVQNHILQDWPIQGLVFEIKEISDKEIDKVVEKVSKIVEFCLTDVQIAHNLFITRTKSGSIRVFLWTRESLFGAKNDKEINAAFCEFTGFFMCKTREMFDNINEEFCAHLLSSVKTRIDQIKHLI